MKIPLLVGHRGYMNKYPENTLCGIEAALQAGACLVEFDVQMNVDGEFFVIHDQNLERTAGVDLDIFSVSQKELQSISVHQTDKFSDQFKEIKIPLLSDALDCFGNYPSSTAVVEIKTESLEQWGTEVVMDRLISELGKKNTKCILISFDADAMSYARKNCDLPVGWVMTAYDEASLAVASELHPDILICNYKKIPVGEAPRKGTWEWMLYDITDPEQAVEYGQLGVEMIETADIGTMLQHNQLKERVCCYGL